MQKEGPLTIFYFEVVGGRGGGGVRGGGEGCFVQDEGWGLPCVSLVPISTIKFRQIEKGIFSSRSCLRKATSFFQKLVFHDED